MKMNSLEDSRFHFLLCLGDISGVINGLLLALCSEVTPGGIKGTICGAWGLARASKLLDFCTTSLALKIVLSQSFFIYCLDSWTQEITLL